ncbi:homocysteine S-methyltransferase family protein [Clostridium paraputrificum]|uniref:homocysteine S-methyltransferase family protein n=1 Tax=Clostridium TaxID=1485 RepID=UPI003D331A80
MNDIEFTKDNILIFDGAMGTMLLKNGLSWSEGLERFNIEKPHIIREIHEEYIKSGAMVITTNTFGANELNIKDIGYSVEEIIDTALNIAKDAIGHRSIHIALDIGPIRELLEPKGNLSIYRAYEIFKRQVIQGEKSGAGLILIETMTDLNEAKVALKAAKENTKLPVFCTMHFDKTGNTLAGDTPERMAKELGELGADAIGINCVYGKEYLLPMVKRIKAVTNLPIIIQPNAGIPTLSKGKAIYEITAKEFSYLANELVGEGVSIIGGCCGTTPEFIKELRRIVENNKLKTI